MDLQGGQRLTIRGEEYFVLSYSTQGLVVTWMTDGGKAELYYLRRKTDNRTFVLKLFKQGFRSARLSNVFTLLKRYAHLPGFQIIRGSECMTPQNDGELIGQNDKFEYAWLMPALLDLGGDHWIPWSQFLSKDKPISLSQEQSKRLAANLANILATMERVGIAHTDLSSDNLVVDQETLEVALIDLDDIYSPDLPELTKASHGKIGYRHPQSQSEGQWKADGDRYGGAILLAEMLAWHDESVRQAAYGDHYFSNLDQPGNHSDRFNTLHQALIKFNAPAAVLLKKAWYACTRIQCPRFSEWVDELRPDPRIELDRAWAGVAAALDDRQLLDLTAVYRRERVALRGAQVEQLLAARRRLHERELLSKAMDNGDDAQILALSLSPTLAGRLTPGEQAERERGRARLETLGLMRYACFRQDMEALRRHYRPELWDANHPLPNEVIAVLREAEHSSEPETLHPLASPILESASSSSSVVESLVTDPLVLLDQWRQGRLPAKDQCSNALIGEWGAVRRLCRAVQQGNAALARRIWNMHRLETSALLSSDDRQKALAVITLAAPINPS